MSIFIDLRKAFDTVSHSLILKKLNLLGVSDIELDWYQSYLRGRRQSVQMNNKCSVLNIGCVSNETNADVCMYIEEFILVEIWIHCCTKLN